MSTQTGRISGGRGGEIQFCIFVFISYILIEHIKYGIKALREFIIFFLNLQVVFLRFKNDALTIVFKLYFKICEIFTI